MPHPKFLLLAAALLLGGPGFAQHVAVVKFAALKQRLAQPTDTTYVINFWATWCAPCVHEMPAFEQVRAAHAGKKVKMLLVSLDYASQLNKKVRPFIEQRNLRADVLLLDEPDPNAWLAQVDARWSGALPFTLIINTNAHQRATFEQALSATELTAALHRFPQ